MKNANYRKYNDRTKNSSKYHKKDGTSIRSKLKKESEIDQMETCRALRCAGLQEESDEVKLKMFMNIFHPNHKFTKELNKKGKLNEKL